MIDHKRLLIASVILAAFSIPAALIALSPGTAKSTPAQAVKPGQAAFTDAAHEAPGVRRHLTVADLPAPAPDQSVDNGPEVVARPANAWPIAPKGFKVESLRHRSRQPAPHPLRTERRSLPR